ncbi:MAG TPA: glycosyltransferase [Candidatus Saccharimonadales bacterium]|nr:glycosyltransferase [Candidatus Saccharimonadales bacterium]
MRIGLVVPHIFLHQDILPQVIFSPGQLALDLAEGLQKSGAEVTLFSPGPVDTPVSNVTADMSYFEQELAGRGDTYMELLKKHPFTFVTLARQVQSELIAAAFARANRGELDVVHIYTNEEDTALPFAQFCQVPVVFTHHDPFNFLVKYKNVFPKYAHLNWLSMSYAQRRGMPADTHWVGNIYHGLAEDAFTPNYTSAGKYLAYLGRIIEPKGLHIAIAAVKTYNQTARQPLTLKIAGKHYAGHKDAYWQEQIEPELSDPHIVYVGHLSGNAVRQEFLGNAAALVVPSTFAEPFGMVMIEALACGTPIIGLDSGAIPEVVQDGQTGAVVEKVFVTQVDPRTSKTTSKVEAIQTAARLAKAFARIPTFDRHACRADFEARFTLHRMCQEHLAAYQRLVKDTTRDS